MTNQNSTRLKRAAILAALLILAGYFSWDLLSHSPSGCYAKIFSIGSSFCHQIPSHSFIVNTLQFPMCARCTGLYMGSFIGITYGLLIGKKAGFPERKCLILLALLFLIWVGDGVNSLLTDLVGKAPLYETTNFTRLTTGYGMGLVMSTALVSLFNITIWKTSEDIPVLNHFSQIAGYLILSSGSALVLMQGGRVIFQAAAYIAIFTAIFIITLLYAIFWVIIWKKENQFNYWIEFGTFLLAGFCTALGQILLLVTVRGKIL